MARLEADNRAHLRAVRAEYDAMTAEMAAAKIREYQEVLKDIRKNMRGDDLMRFKKRYQKRIQNLKKRDFTRTRAPRINIPSSPELRAAEREQAYHFKDDQFTQRMIAFAEKTLGI